MVSNQLDQQAQAQFVAPKPVAWYHKKWFVVLTLIVFFPVGLALLWTSPATKLSGRITWSIIWALAIVINLAGGGGSSTSQSVSAGVKAGQQAASGSKAPAKPAAPTYDFSVKVDTQTYKGKFASNVGVAVTDVKTADQVGGQFMQQKAQGRFILVQVAITNNQKDKIMLSSSSFKILANGKEYSTSSDAQVAFGSEHGAIIFDELNPDLTKSGWLVFDVPPTLDPATAEFQFTGGAVGKKGVLPLKPITE